MRGATRNQVSATGRGAKALAQVAQRFLAKLGLTGVELSLSLVSDRRIRTLNRDWRGKDKATDVLSFPTGDEGGGPGLRQLGDVVISVDTVRRVAKERGTSQRHELHRYLAHGLLHLLGHDHHRRAESARMKAAETALLGERGML